MSAVIGRAVEINAALVPSGSAEAMPWLVQGEAVPHATSACGSSPATGAAVDATS